MLLERLKRLEEEKSQLVLENENQRQQYEKCLDEIANQVVQALLSQKVSSLYLVLMMVVKSKLFVLNMSVFIPRQQR